MQDPEENSRQPLADEVRRKQKEMAKRKIRLILFGLCLYIINN